MKRFHLNQIKFNDRDVQDLHNRILYESSSSPANDDYDAFNKNLANSLISKQVDNFYLITIFYVLTFTLNYLKEI